MEPRGLLTGINIRLQGCARGAHGHARSCRPNMLSEENQVVYELNLGVPDALMALSRRRARALGDDAPLDLQARSVTAATMSHTHTHHKLHRPRG